MCNSVQDIRCIKNIMVSWDFDQASNTNYYVQLTGKQAHSYNDAYNLCARIRNGDAYPAIYQTEDFVVMFLKKQYKRLNIDPGKH